MISFDDLKMIEDIKKNGITANDKTGNYKLKMLTQYFLSNTSYSEKGIIDRVKKIASDYYKGLGDSFRESDIKRIIETVKQKAVSINPKKTITLYKSEMETISAIKDENMQRIMFSALVCFKHESQHEENGKIVYFNSVQECKSDIYRYADIPNVSGSNRNIMMKKLSDMGLIKFFVLKNKDHKWNQTSWVAMTRYTVPFCVDIIPDKSKEKKWMDVTNYEDILLYWRLYKQDKDVTVCQNCGCPIIRGKSKRYCSDCASLLKKKSDKTRYENTIAFA